jgi:multidrug efflux pump subunit AcrA (membrane-fusion protein)
MKLRLLLPLGLAMLTACHSQAGGQSPAPDAGRKILYYRSSMNPSFISKLPGKDTMGMELVAVHEGDPGAEQRGILLDGATLQRMGVRIAPVRRERLTRIVRALGRVDFDETRVSNVNMKFDGWIDKLWVDETGQFVAKGAPLFAVYSPELMASEEEYLQALRGAAAGPYAARMVQAARERLLQFDVPASFIDEIGASGKAQRNIVIRAPSKGFVVHKTAFVGTFVKMGANLFTLADLKALWVVADVYESDAAWVFRGQAATVEFDYLPGQVQEAKVDYVYPTMDLTSRTLQVRVVLPNPRVVLKPGMFATVRIHAQPTGETLVVPAEAVIHSGERSVVFVSLGNGRFEPRDVKLGISSDEKYQVLSGVKEGEAVVTSGEFLLDSESHLKEAVEKMLGSNVGDGGAAVDGGPDAR